MRRAFPEPGQTRRYAPTPLIYWAGGIETAESLKQAGVEQIAAPAPRLRVSIKLSSKEYPKAEPQDFVNDETAIEFSISRIGIYAVIDLIK